MPLSGLPIRSTAFAVLLVVLHKRSVLRVPSLLLNLYLLLVILNLVNVPGGWHWRVFVTPIARIRLQQLRAKLGLHSGKGSRAKELGIDPKYYHLKSIGIAPQAGTTWLQKRVTIGDSDIFMHLNNACYNNVTDMGRMTWTLEYFGSLLVNENPTSHLGGISLVFFKEIPIFTAYETETRLISWNDRWAYAWTRFVLPVNASTKKPGKDIIVQTTRGPRILCAIALSKVTVKLPKQKGVTRCGRLISAAGFGPDATNWNQALKLRKERKIKAWMEGLEDPDGSDGLEAYEEDRVKALELLNQLGSGDKKDAWLAVDAIADKYSKPLPAQQ